MTEMERGSIEHVSQGLHDSEHVCFGKRGGQSLLFYHVKVLLPFFSSLFMKARTTLEGRVRDGLQHEWPLGGIWPITRVGC